MNTTENNKLIAEFMGCIIRDENGNLPTESGQHKLFVKEEWDKLNVCSPYSPNGVEYHTSWEWLMPVVEKIKEMHNNREIILHRFAFGLHYIVLKAEIGRKFFRQERPVNNNLKEPMYTTLVEFIKWYNENK